jgi:putative intracellular protease/amidase
MAMQWSDAMILRRQFTNMLLTAPTLAAGCSVAQPALPVSGKIGFSYLPGLTSKQPLIRPTGRAIKVGFAINPGVQVIDLAGPWDTFQDTYASPDADSPAFEMFTASETIAPVRASGGLMMVPDFSIDTAPAPDVIVVPHFAQPNPASREMSGIHHWIKEMHGQAALTLSVWTGAFQLAKTGLLDNIPMTTNQLASNNFAKAFPEIDLHRGGASSRPGALRPLAVSVPESISRCGW